MEEGELRIKAKSYEEIFTKCGITQRDIITKGSLGTKVKVLAIEAISEARSKELLHIKKH